MSQASEAIRKHHRELVETLETHVKALVVVLHVVTPPPTEADHAEVRAGLQRGQWR